MTDSVALKGLIKSKGLKLKYVAEYLGLSSYGFTLKVENKKEFKTSEVAALCELLKIDSLDTKEKIFFAKKMIINHRKAGGRGEVMWEKIAIIAITIGVVCVMANIFFVVMQIRKLAKKIDTLRKVAELQQSQIEMLCRLPKEGIRMYEVIRDLSQIQQSQLELIKRLL